MKMDIRNCRSFQEDWSCQTTTPMDVLNHLSQEALRIAGDALPITPPGSPSFSSQGMSAPPRHRRARSEVVTSFHSRSKSSSNLQKWKSNMKKALNWGSRSFREDKNYTSFDPEVLANQKRQWYKLRPRKVDPERYKEPSTLFEHFVVVGLHPDAKLEDVEDAFISRKKCNQEMKRTEMVDSNIRHRRPKIPTLEPEVRFEDPASIYQVLFQYPPRKKLTLELKDLSSFCFPEGVKAHVVDKTPSSSELNQLLYGQEYLHRDDLSFIFSLKAADNTPLYGVCLHVQEVVQKPPVIYGVASLSQFQSRNSRFLVSAPRCYCILTRMPFFELHYEMLASIIAQDRLNRINKSVTDMFLNDKSPSRCISKHQINENIDGRDAESATDWISSAIPVDSAGPLATAAAADIISCEETLKIHSPGSAATATPELDKDGNKNMSTVNDNTFENPESQSISDQTSDASPYACCKNQSSACRRFESLFCPAKSMSLEADNNDDEGFTDDKIMKWARENKNGMLQIICAYHGMHIPERGSKVVFQPLEHLQGIEYLRPSISFLGLDEKYIDHKLTCSEEEFEVKLKLAAAEEAVSLSLWSIATICRVLSIESILTLLTGVLLEKHMIVQCPNLGILSAVVLSLNPIIRPFEWQSLFLPILPEKMLDFLDAPVPFIVGVQHKPVELKMKASNLVQVNVSENEVKSCVLPPLPRRYELIAQLRPIHSRLSCEDSIAQKCPIYKCSEVQAEAASQFLCVMRRYLESLCSDMRLHTITSVQASDKVSILLKDSFIESFPTRDRYFIKLFVETQLFTVLSDARLSSYENE